MPVRIEALTPPAPEAILVGDPRRAFTLAQAFTEEARMSHLARGLWGYTGKTPDGRGLTVQSTGAGGPAASVVLSDLIGAGVGTVIRLGTCESVAGGPEPGRVALVTSVLAFDGAGMSLAGTDQAGAIVRPDESLTARLGDELGDSVVAIQASSHDLVARMDRAGAPSAAIRDLQTAAVLATGAELGVPAATLLIVVEDDQGNRLTEAEVEEGLIDLWPGVARTLGKA